MAIEVFNRYEHKYQMDTETYKKITNTILKHMEIDRFNTDGKLYTISNIYYDTLHNNLIRKSLQKPIYKEKLRLRAYGVPTLDSKVYMEIKKKVNGLVNKRRTTILLKDAYSFAKTGIKPKIEDYMNSQVINELDFFLNTHILSPKTIIAYDRLAFFEKGNPDLRVSFDTNVRTRREDLALELGDYGSPLLPEGIWLMEIKVSKNMPIWLVELLSQNKLYKTSFSKYGTEFKTNLLHESEDKQICLTPFSTQQLQMERLQLAHQL